MTRFAFLGWMVGLLFAMPCLAQAPATQPASVITFKVIDSKTQHPIADAKVTGFFEQKRVKATSDASGVVTLEYTPPLRYAGLTASKEGYAQRTVRWQDRSESPVVIPAEYTLALETGTTIAGVVKSTDGTPVENAQVLIVINTKYSENESFNIYNEKVKTDIEGGWSYSGAPSKIDNFRIDAEHPDFAHEIYTGNGDQPTLGQLRDGTATITLKPGIRVTGRVLNSAGEPLRGAKVAPGRDRFGSNSTAAVKTDADGRFSYTAKPDEQLPLTITAKGFAPTIVTVTPDASLKPLEIKLNPGRKLSVKVVDQAGSPVEDVMIVPDTWRGHRSLEMRFDTDNEGRMQWTDAPDDAIAFDILKQGFADLRRFSMTARDEEYVVTLKPMTTVSGSVIDADTGKPVANFKIIKGITFNDGRPISWENREPMDGKDGKFAYQQGYPYPGHAVRIIADGYAVADSRTFTSDEAEVKLEFKLTPAKPTAGTVLLSDGSPASGAEIYVTNSNIMIENGMIPEHARRDVMSWTTDPDGKFSIPPQPTGTLVLILHESGYAELKSEQLIETTKLQPWASVEGTMFIGAAPAGNAKVGGWSGREYRENEPNIHISISGTTDAHGRFKLERLLAGKVGIGRYVQLTENMSSYSHSVRLDLKPGDHQTITIGGKGRPVIGRIQIPDEVLAIGNWKPGHTMLSIDVPMPQLPTPANWDDMETEAKQKWYADWMKSPEGLRYQDQTDAANAKRKDYPVVIQRDGSFRIEDVESGKYTLSVSLEQPRSDSTCGFGDPIARGSTEVVVPEMPEGRSDEPLEVPTIALTAIRTVKVGDAAPGFDVPDFNGNPIRLEDFRGKYVLLDFWATWCGPCVAETPHLLEAWNAFGSNEKFVMIGLSLDQKIDAPQKYVAKKELGWKQGFLGEWGKSKLPGEYGVNGIPSIWLIGPDGKVIARDLRGAAIKQEIAKHLGG